MKTKRLLDYLSVGILMVFLMGYSNAKAQDIATSADGVQISFEKKGKGKPAIIFIHGWTNPRTIWQDQVEYFSNEYTAIAIDLAGSGKSGHDRTHWTIEAFSKDVMAVMDKLELNKAVLVGFSMGARVAVETANQFPNRVIGVVTVDDLKFPNRQIPEEMIATLVNNVTAMERTNENLVAGGFYKRNHEANFERITAIYEGLSNVGWKESLEEAIRWNNKKLKISLMNLKVPLRGIFSDKELFEIDSIKAYAPSFKGEIIANTGHLVFWDAPNEFNEVLNKDIQEFVD